eukprot:CAMPEP_0183777596 /NCGR_PEP_ID=MMETSP0739-20130205/49433_1 /TAXON_ID=385413 /ORGANISM="Thalassiosira miniscula, Strain CCMP1093" /LENGTH=132 /DNA_ID=CAMNT_0026019765 /DNA_START=11 /DNA_END=405 /DNA_ORIENTATION=-
MISFVIGQIAASADPQQQWRIPSPEELPSVLGVCVTGTLAHFLMNYGVKCVPATLSSLLQSSDIFWAYIIEIVVFTQHPPAATWFGVTFVCSSLLLVLLTSSEKTTKKMEELESIKTDESIETRNAPSLSAG